MRWTAGVLLVVSLAPVAMARPRARRAAGPAAPSTAAAAAQPATSPAGGVRIVPVQDKPGWIIVEVPGGFYRYRAPTGAAPSQAGTLSILSSAAAQSLRPRQPPAPPASVVPAPRPVAPRPACERQRGLLNQRLWELRGIDVDPASANLLSRAEVPLSPSAWGFVQGYGPGLASDLPNAVSADMIARDRLRALAACLQGDR